MHIRESNQGDFLLVNALMRELNPKDSFANNEAREKVFLDVIDDPRNFIFVGDVNDVIVTSCYLNIIPNITWDAAPYAVIENVVTAQAHRRKGYGRQCIQYAIDQAFLLGCFKVMLMSSQRNDKTREFYKSVGLEQSKDGYVIYKKFI